MLQDAFRSRAPLIKVKGAGDIKRADYTFEIGRTGTQSSESELALTFIDTAGENFNKHEHDSDLQGYMSEAHAAVLVIDTIELMCGEQIRHHQRRNQPDIIHNHVQRWLRTNPAQPRLLCIVPSKTETWLRQRTHHDHSPGKPMSTRR